MPPPTARAIHLALDAYGLMDASRHRGIGTYVRNLVAGLAARSDVALTVLGPGPQGVPEGVSAVALEPRLASNLVPSSTARLALARAEHGWRVARAMHGIDAAILHSPGQEPPRASSLPFVQTIHDLTPLVLDHPLLRRDRRRWERVAGRVRAASAVIVPSRSSADQVSALLGVDPQVVHVVPLAPDPAMTIDPGEELEPAQAPYLLMVSAWGPHKGLREASEVIARLAQLGYPHRLLIAGALDAWSRDRAWADVVAGGGSARTQLLGYSDQLGALYRSAAAVLSTSRAEGFGLPVVEAMALGTPVVAFANTSLPEVVGDGGALVPDGDTEAMANAVRSLLDDAQARLEAGRRASAWASRFSWSATVEAHVAVYRTVADG